ncbi:MAG: hypothetical protein SFW36_05260, partial [Leptolyngbyaceae cyanobacterium bins.59]|nr:hypothetical protein [Leptolyngbyaceae cyanobacterium bins.59]
RPSPIDLSVNPPEAPSVERVSIFSEELVRELPKLKRTVLQPLEPLITEGDPLAVPRPPGETEDLQLSFSANLNYPPDLEPIEIVGPTTQASDSPFLPEDSLFHDTTPFTKLPHLIRSPELKVLQSPPRNSLDQTVVPVTLTCWLTRHFLIPVTEGEQNFYQLKRFNEITLSPGQSIICRLGFEWRVIPVTTRVQLGKSLKAHQGLTATWGITNRLRYVLSEDLKSYEASITLSNYSSQSCTLQAGQPLCRLEFACPMAQLSTFRWEDNKKTP